MALDKANLDRQVERTDGKAGQTSLGETIVPGRGGRRAGEPIVRPHPGRSGLWRRRELLAWTAHGLTGAALAALLQPESRQAAVQAGESSQATGSRSLSPETAGSSHFPPRARRIVHVCLCGGLSHLDSFDFKPELARYHGQPLPSSERPETFFNQIGLLRKNDWPFQRRGQSGLWVSDLFPHLATVADELTVIKSMVADSANHTPATFQENTGFALNGFPTMGAWVSYGLGAETEDLPAYVVLPDTRGYPAGGTINWSNGFLPSRHQGVPFETEGSIIPDLFPARPLSSQQELASRDFLRRLNERDLARHPGDEALAARIRSYELAARMQLAVPQVTDLARETEPTRAAYGLDQPDTADFGRSCLLARRLLEQGVRFVQLFSGGSFGSPRINWDGHEDMVRNHTREAVRIDQPVAALILDLKQRGLLSDTLVLLTSEFGRTPFTQSAADKVGTGRDHNMYGFTTVMAGGGLRSGFAYGSTDDIGWKAVLNPVPWYDFHATILHLLGLDHTRLTFYHNGIRRRLTNVHGQVLQDLIA